VDRIGKDISGTGMDTNVIGRRGIEGAPPLPGPDIARVVALRLSEKSGGNAYGIGLADVTTRNLARAADTDKMMANAMASTFLERARMPLCFESDREAIMAAVRTSGAESEEILMARIKDTLHLSELYMSPALLETAGGRVDILSGPAGLVFDDMGNLDTVEVWK